MGLYNDRLTDDEVAALKALLHALYEDEETKDFIRAQFKLYLRSEHKVYLDKYQLARVLNHPDKVPLERRMLLYDFAYEKLSVALLRGDLPASKDLNVMEKVKDFRDLGEGRRPMPWSIKGLHEFLQPVPASFQNRFFGYRMSANAGSVIRFYLEITSGTDETEVRYHNLYRRKDVRLDISGTGRFIYETLYLLGHATDLDKSATEGLRMLALRRIGNTKKLCGIVLSDDRRYPIAARVLLIPVDAHVHGRQLQEFKKVRKAIMEDFRDHSIEELVGDLMSHTLDDIKMDEKESDDHTFGTYIENAAPTVLKAGTEVLYDIGPLTKQMMKLRKDVQNPPGDSLARRVAGGMTGALEAFNDKKAAGSFKFDEGGYRLLPEPDGEAPAGPTGDLRQSAQTRRA